MRHQCWMKWGAVALAAVLVVGCKPPEGQGVTKGTERGAAPPREERQFMTPVVGLAVLPGEVVATVATTANVVPIRSRLINAEEGGRLHFANPWSEGDFLEAGTVIATLQSDTLRAEIDRAVADISLQEESLDISRKSMDSSVREYRIFQDLYSRGIAALKDLETNQLAMERAINSFRQGEINLKKARRALEDLRDREERLEIRAPFDGLIVARTTLDGSKPFATTFGSETIVDTEGRMVNSGAAICGFIDVNRVLLRCDVTSRDIDRVRPEQEVMATIYAANDIAVTGTVAEIARAVSQDTRAFRVDVLVENPERLLRPGMFARVEIITERRTDTVSIRKDYIVRRNNRDVVFVAGVAEDSELAIAREVPVELGLEGREHIEVLSGLKPDDIIIIRGYEVLQDRTPISLLRADLPVEPGGS